MTTQSKPQPITAHATVDKQGVNQTFNARRTAADALREEFAAKNEALLALHSAERRVEICAGNVCTYTERIQGLALDVELARATLDAHSTVAAKAKEVAEKRPTAATIKAYNEARKQAQASRKAHDEKHAALEGASEGLTAAQRAKKDAEQELKRAREAYNRA